MSIESLFSPERGASARSASAPVSRRFVAALLSLAICASPLAAVVERVRGVDHASTLQLMRGGTPRGTVLRVRPDRIVVAGDLDVTVTAGAS